MVAIIVDNHVHRLLSDGSVESQSIVEFGDFDDWQVLNPELDLGISAGEFDAFIRKNLITLNQIFPADRPKLPVSEKQESVAVEVHPV